MSSESKNLPVLIGDKRHEFPETAKKVLLTRTQSGWNAEEVASLGESDVFVIRNRDGELRLIKKVVHLFEAKKEIASVGGNWIVTVPGYATLNRVAGIHQITPSSVLVAGKEESNPYVVYNSKGEIVRIIARKIALGYSPIGNLIAVDAVRHYNFEAYYLQDLQAKATKHPNDVRFGVRFACPLAPAAKVEERDGTAYVQTDKGIFLFKPIKDIEGLWLNVNSGEVADVYKQHIAHQKFGEVIAQNLAWRNALKAHPAIATTQVIVSGGCADVVVYGFKSELTRSRLEELGAQVSAGMEMTDVKIEKVDDEASYEELVTERENIVVAETVEEGTPQPETSASEPKKEDATEEIKARIKKLATEKGVPDLEVFCRNSMGTPFAELTQEQLTRFAIILEKAGSSRKGGTK